MCRYNACFEEFPVCFECLHKLQSLITAECRSCGFPPSACTCGSNSGKRFLFFYGSPESKWLMYNIKYNADKRSLSFLAEMLIRTSGINTEAYDGVTYVPRTKRNIRRYGYDQSLEIAKAVSKLYGIPLVHTLKRVGKDDQKLLSRDKRRENIINRYRAYPTPDEKYKRLLLIDDICTTGATVEVCASIIRQNFARTVTILVLAKTNYLNKPNGG